MTSTKGIRSVIFDYLRNNGAQPICQLCRHLRPIIGTAEYNSDYFIEIDVKDTLSEMIEDGSVVEGMDLYGLFYTIADRRETP